MIYKLNGTKDKFQKKNHKQKEHKEKKQRSRPKGIIKQHQEQHQIVNVNIGRSTHSSENKEGKRKE